MRRLGGAGRVWAFTALLAGTAAGLYVAFVGSAHPRPLPFHLPLWLLAGTFFLAEVMVVYVQFRRNAYSFSLSEVPLVIGLFTAMPWEVLVAHLVGSALALGIYRRQSFFKVAFNLSHFALETTLALMIFGMFRPADPLDPLSWGGAALAVLATTIVADVAIGAGVSLAERNWEVHRVFHGLAFGKVVGATNIAIGLIGVMILAIEPLGAYLLVVPAAILFFAYRVYTAQREQHERMELLYESTHMLSRSLKMEAAIPALLSQARDMFRAERAEMLLFPSQPDDPLLRTTFGADEEPELMRPVHLDPTEGAWARVAAEGQPVLLARPIQSKRLRAHFEARGIRDGMVAPLQGPGGVVGTIMVANRESDVATFDAEDLKLFEALANHANVSLENARLVQRLEESLERLTESNQMKDDFVATVSHELRTPLTTIQGSIKTLLQPDVTYDHETQRSLLEAVDRQGETLRRLIEDLLVAARIESQVLHAVVAPVAVGDLARRTVDALTTRAAHHHLRVRAENALPPIETDAQRVEQIVSNLLDNALKYTPAGSSITVGVRPAGRGVEVSVEDDGPGIPMELQGKIFERFYQVDQTSTRAVGGTGLGLWICSRLAELIGGRVSFRPGSDRGSVFALWIPSRPPEHAIPASEEPIETIDLLAAGRG